MKTAFHFTLPPKLAAKLLRLAENDRRKPSKLLRCVVEDWLEDQADDFPALKTPFEATPIHRLTLN